MTEPTDHSIDIKQEKLKAQRQSYANVRKTRVQWERQREIREMN